MTLDEFKEKALDEEWTPGWTAIDEEFEELYQQEPLHFATNMIARAILGGDEYIDGYSVYHSVKGHKHLVTYGMTELYIDEEWLGEEWNKWGYEMTIKWWEEEKDNQNYNKLLIDILANFARYTYKQDMPFDPEEVIKCNVAAYLSSLNIDMSTSIVGFITVLDTEVNTIDTIYGKVEFIQLVGVIQEEYDKIIKNKDLISTFILNMKKENPLLITDFKRTKSYL